LNPENGQDERPIALAGSENEQLTESSSVKE